MKTATVKELKDELKERTPSELLAMCLRLSRFKKENKELLTYLLFESGDEESYINSIKVYIDTRFSEINTRTSYFVKKSIRAILKDIKKYIRYSKKKETEVELLIYFCQKLDQNSHLINRSRVMTNLYERQLEFISRRVDTLHEDLQYDYKEELKLL